MYAPRPRAQYASLQKLTADTGDMDNREDVNKQVGSITGHILPVQVHIHTINQHTVKQTRHLTDYRQMVRCTRRDHAHK